MYPYLVISANSSSKTSLLATVLMTCLFRFRAMAFQATFFIQHRVKSSTDMARQSFNAFLSSSQPGPSDRGARGGGRGGVGRGRGRGGTLMSYNSVAPIDYDRLNKERYSKMDGQSSRFLILHVSPVCSSVDAD